MITADQQPGVYESKSQTYVLDRDYGWWQWNGFGLNPVWHKPPHFLPVRVADLPEDEPTDWNAPHGNV